MGRDIKSYLKNKGMKVPPEIPKGKEAEAEMIRRRMQQYEGKSESELKDELARSIAQGKKDGSFNEESVNQFVKNVSPMLNDAQRKKMQEILKQFR